MAGKYQRKDHLYQKAKQEGYRSRAAYKLAELQQKYKLMRSGSKVVDLGCFPGGWLQVALEIVGVKGRVVGIDLKEVEPVSIAGNAAVIIQGDLTSEDKRKEVVERAQGKVDLVLSDLSPSLTGVKFRDAVHSAELVELALEVACDILKRGGSFVAKIFPGPESDELAARIRKRFRHFARPVLEASRKSSKEYYFVARDFVGLEDRAAKNEGIEAEADG